MRLFSSIQARLLSALIPLPASITAGGKAIKKEGKNAFQTDLCKLLNLCMTKICWLQVQRDFKGRDLTESIPMTCVQRRRVFSEVFNRLRHEDVVLVPMWLGPLKSHKAK